MKNPRSADDEDFNSAAESLLGIDLSSSGLSSAPIDLDDADLFGEPDVVEPEPVKASEPRVEETQEFRAAPAPVVFDDDDFGDFGAGLVSDEPPRPARQEPRPAPRAPERPSPRVEDRPARRTEERPAPRAHERTPDPEPAAAPPPAPRKDDSYWDALEGFDWSEESTAGSKSAPQEEAPPQRGRSSDRSRGRSGGGRQSRRSDEPPRRSDEQSRRSEEPPRRSEEKPRRSEEQSRRSETPPPARPSARPPVESAESFGDDFGSGLEEKSPPRRGRASAEESVFPLRPSDSQSRSGRGRGRSADADADVSTFGLDPSESQVRDLEGREESARRPKAPPRAEIPEGDDFGMGLDEDAGTPRRTESGRDAFGEQQESSAGEQRRGRRRGRGGRGRGQGQGQGQDGGQRGPARPPVESRRFEPDPEVDLSFDAVVEELPSRDEPLDDDAQESRFADVPTWAEAIGLLVKQRPRTSSTSSGDRGHSESSSDSGDRGGSGGGRGRGRGRRGGGGGRRPN